MESTVCSGLDPACRTDSSLAMEQPPPLHLAAQKMVTLYGLEWSPFSKVITREQWQDWTQPP